MIGTLAYLFICFNSIFLLIPKPVTNKLCSVLRLWRICRWYELKVLRNGVYGLLGGKELQWRRPPCMERALRKDPREYKRVQANKEPFWNFRPDEASPSSGRRLQRSGFSSLPHCPDEDPRDVRTSKTETYFQNFWRPSSGRRNPLSGRNPRWPVFKFRSKVRDIRGVRDIMKGLLLLQRRTFWRAKERILKT